MHKNKLSSWELFEIECPNPSANTWELLDVFQNANFKLKRACEQESTYLKI